MLVKAVAHHTTAAFIRVVGSEFVQKYLGEGPCMVRDIFRLARETTVDGPPPELFSLCFSLSQSPALLPIYDT
jgi:hypothetical protein